MKFQYRNMNAKQNINSNDWPCMYYWVQRIVEINWVFFKHFWFFSLENWCLQLPYDKNILFSATCHFYVMLIWKAAWHGTKNTHMYMLGFVKCGLVWKWSKANHKRDEYLKRKHYFSIWLRNSSGWQLKSQNILIASHCFILFGAKRFVRK